MSRRFKHWPALIGQLFCPSRQKFFFRRRNPQDDFDDEPEAKVISCEECKVVRQVRNDAAFFYATEAIAMANMEGDSLVGNQVEVFRNDVNYIPLWRYCTVLGKGFL